MNDLVFGLDELIGERLKERREAKGCSVGQLARLLNISVQEVQRYERGVLRLSAQRLQQAAELLETSVLYFFQGLDKDLYAADTRQSDLFKRAAYDYLKNLLDHIADPVFVKDRNHCWIDGNRAFWELMGGPPEAFLGKTDYDFFPKAEADVFWEKDDQVFGTGQTVVNEEYLTDSRGKKHILSTKKALFINGRGEPVLVGIIRDITLEKELDTLKKQAALFQKEQQYRSIFESTNDAIFIFDTHGHLVEANPVASKIYGYTNEEFTRMRGTDLTPPEDFLKFSQFMEQALSGKRYCVEGVHLRKDKTPINVEISGTAFVYADAPHLLAVVREITERKKAQWALEEADRRKDQFLAMLAHELRNPLAPISNAMHILGAPVSEHIRQETISMVNRQIGQITHLLNDLLDVSRITLGKIQLRRENIPLSQIIAMAVQNAKPLMEEKEHTLEVHTPEQPIWVYADVTRLSQVFSNLLNNAAKYTERGGHITVNVSHDRLGVTVRVKDNGTGITKEMLTQVFDLFAQEDNSMERTQGGLGIGLTLVKKLVEMHKGSIAAYSEGKGKGSEFTVRLPIQIMASLPEMHAPPADKAPDAVYRVLVVDDNVASAKTLGWSLELLGHRVQVVNGGREALEAVKASVPDVVLLDIGLPGMNGFEVCSAMREMPALEHTVIIAQTGWGQKEHVQHAKEVGFNHHLVKPVQIDTLQEILRGVKSGGKGAAGVMDNR